MRNRLPIAAVIFLGSVLFSVVACAADDLYRNSAPATSVPHPAKGTWSGNGYIFAGACPGGSNLVIDTAVGFATLAGASNLFAAYCLNPLTGHGEGNAVITAANGDTLFFAISIQLSFTSQGGGTWDELETVLGGTGRFAGANGASTASGTWAFTSPTTITWVGSFDGEIIF